MARIGIISIPLPSHLAPHIALGTALAREGHEVSVYQIESHRAACVAAGLGFVSLSDEGDALDRFLARLATLSGPRAFIKTVQGALAYARLVEGRLPMVLRQEAPDYLLVDQSDLIAHAVAEASGTPFASICPALPIHREPDVPPPVTGWRYRTGRIGRFRNALGYALWDAILLPLRWRINSSRAGLGLPPIAKADDALSKRLHIIPLPKALDFPRLHMAGAAVYTGPFFDVANSPYPRSTDLWRRRFSTHQPLVYASLGTLTNQRTDVFLAMARACEANGASLIIGCGGNKTLYLELLALGLPGNPLVLEFAPQREVLLECDAFFSHGGVNSVVDSCAAAVPLVIVPFANDQPAMAARVAHAGACRIVPLHAVNAARMAQELGMVLNDRRYKDAAGRLREALLETGGLPTAVAAIQASIRAAFVER